MDIQNYESKWLWAIDVIKQAHKCRILNTYITEQMPTSNLLSVYLGCFDKNNPEKLWVKIDEDIDFSRAWHHALVIYRLAKRQNKKSGDVMNQYYRETYPKFSTLFSLKEIDEIENTFEQHGYKALLSLLKQKAKTGWISVEQSLPKTAQRVWVVIRHKYNDGTREIINFQQTVACYIPKLTVLEEDFMIDHQQGEGDYCEEKDEFYTPQGWYEQQLYTDENYKLDDDLSKVTHWMPLPDFPQSN